MTSTYNKNRENRPKVKGYSLEELWNNQVGPNFWERFKNKELGSQKMDQIINSIKDDWNALDGPNSTIHEQNFKKGLEIFGTELGKTYQDKRSIDSFKELINPIDLYTAIGLRTIEAGGYALDATVGNAARFVSSTLGLDPRWGEVASTGAQVFVGPAVLRALPKGFSAASRLAGSSKSLNTANQLNRFLKQSLNQLDEATYGLRKVPASKRTITVKDFATILDETWQMPSQELQRIVKLAKQPGINSFTLAKRLNEQKGIINEYLKKFGHGNKPDLKNILDPLDQPTYKGSFLDLNTATHPTTYDGVNTINTLLNKHGGFKSGRLNLKSYDLKGNLDKRIAATVFITPYGKGGNFQAIAKREKSVVYQIFGTDLERMGFAPITEKMGTSPSVQAHHADSPIKAIVPGFEGIVKESPKYHRFTKLFFDEMLALGDMPENIIGVLGHTARDPDSPHSLSHLFTRYMMGEDGRLFWTKEKLDQIVVYDNEGNAIGTKNDDLREKFMLEQIDLLKDNIKVLENATEQYKILFEQGIQDPATVIEYFEDKLPNLDKEYIRAFAPKVLEKFIADVKAEEAATVQANPITITERNEIIDNIFRRENVKEWRLWPVAVRKAKMKEITGTEILDYDDGYTFEQIEAFIDAGWLDDERLYELFNPPIKKWEDLYPD